MSDYRKAYIQARKALVDDATEATRTLQRLVVVAAVGTALWVGYLHPTVAIVVVCVGLAFMMKGR